MADPQTAIANQLRNIEAKTGKTFAQLCRLIADSGLTKVGEQRTMLMDTLHLGYGDANALALLAKQAAAPAPADADPLDAIYAGAKAPLRALHDRSARRDRQARDLRDRTEEDLRQPAPEEAVRDARPGDQGPARARAQRQVTAASARLKAMPPGGMCQYTVRLSTPGDIDAELMSWVRAAYDAAA